MTCFFCNSNEGSRRNFSNVLICDKCLPYPNPKTKTEEEINYLFPKYDPSTYEGQRKAVTHRWLKPEKR